MSDFKPWMWNVSDQVYMSRVARKTFIRRVFGFLPINWRDDNILAYAVNTRICKATGQPIKPRVRYKLMRRVHYLNDRAQMVYK